jgi:fructokinase
MPVGIDLGGTKIEAVVLGAGGAEIFRERVATPRHDYAATIAAVAGLVARTGHQKPAGVGVAIPGCVSKITGLIKNANSTWLNGRPLQHDLEAALGCPVSLANDANCFVLSEATDGAGAGAGIVFGVIAGTGTGGGVAVGGRVLEGAHGLAGEWGHNPLPGMSPEEWAEAPACYCGKRGCIETWISGIGLAADFLRYPLRPSQPRGSATATSPVMATPTGEADLGWTAEKIAASDEPEARAAMARFTDRFARALASVVNILDPDVIVLGGGLSNIQSLYRDLPPLVAHYAFTIEGLPKIVQNRHGDSSGVRGAAWLAPT